MSTPSGSDDAFSMFAFAIVSCVLILIYIPVLTGLLWDIFYLCRPRQAPQNRSSTFKQLLADATWFPRILLALCTRGDTGALVAYLRKTPSVSSAIATPRIRAFIFRPRLLLLWVWLVLLSFAMYARLTFDAHAVLGLPSSASLAEVKRAGRKLMRRYHPDVNKSEEAKVIYPQVFKAYKALVDPETFLRDTEKETSTFGLALPEWLTSRDNDLIVLVTCFGILLSLPLYVWSVLRGKNRVEHHLEKIVKLEQARQQVLCDLGVPRDREHIQSLVDRDFLLDTFRKLNVNMSVNDFLQLPSLRNLHRWCVGKDTRKLTEHGCLELQPYLVDFWKSHPLPKELEKQPQEFVKSTAVPFSTLMLLLQSAQGDIDELVANVGRIVASQVMAGQKEMKVVRQLREHHVEVAKTVAQVYEKDDVANLKLLVESGRVHEELLTKLRLMAEEARNKAGCCVGQTLSTSDVEVAWFERSEYILLVVSAKYAEEVKVTLSDRILMVAGEHADSAEGPFQSFTTELLLAHSLDQTRFVSKTTDDSVWVAVGKTAPQYWECISEEEEQLPWLKRHSAWKGPTGADKETWRECSQFFL